MSEQNKLKEILKKRIEVISKHHEALSSYHGLIKSLLSEKNIYDIDTFNSLIPQEKAILEAYLKRFSSTQDYMGSKIFPILLKLVGVGVDKMSDILYHIEKEHVIDSLEKWIELREIRNDLEHEYPYELEQALVDLKRCIDNFIFLDKYYHNCIYFIKNHNL